MFSNKSKQVTCPHVYVVVNRIAERAGLDKKSGCNSFRRSRAEYLLDRNLPVTFVSKFLRQKRLETTMTYLDVSIVDINREMEKIEDINLFT